MNRIIIINATATKKGGALTILKEYINELKKNNNDKYYIFCGADIDYNENDLIKLIKIKTDGVGAFGIKRIYWDFFGLFYYCKRNNIKPDLIISFQNTGVFFPKKKQLIYFHQPIPLYNFKWNLFSKSEAVFYFYKKIYPFFVRLLISNKTTFVVQLNFIKKLFVDKFKINSNKVYVIKPNVNAIDKSNLSLELDKSYYHIFYPTSFAKYKNVSILLDAMEILKKENKEAFSNIKLHITLRRDNKELNRIINKKEINSAIDLTGIISFQEVNSYYQNIDLMVFPSYIETFGLPLAEAANIGLPIIASDMEYSREVLDKYSGVSYATYNNPLEWAHKILKNYNNRGRFKPINNDINYNSWRQFIELSNSIIDQNV